MEDFTSQQQQSLSEPAPDTNRPLLEHPLREQASQPAHITKTETPPPPPSSDEVMNEATEIPTHPEQHPPPSLYACTLCRRKYQTFEKAKEHFKKAHYRYQSHPWKTFAVAGTIRHQCPACTNSCTTTQGVFQHFAYRHGSDPDAYRYFCFERVSAE